VTSKDKIAVTGYMYKWCLMMVMMVIKVIRYHLNNGSDGVHVQVVLDDGYDGVFLYDKGDKVSPQ